MFRKIKRWIMTTSRIVVLASAAVFAQFATGQTVLRVDVESAATTPDGSTWALAYKHLSDAIDQIARR